MFRGAWASMQIAGGNPDALRFFFGKEAHCLYFASFLIVLYFLYASFTASDFSYNPIDCERLYL